LRAGPALRHSRILVSSGGAKEGVVGYLIAAYAAVLLTLAVYGIWIQAQRRTLIRRALEQSRRPPLGRGGA
jgi:hypothetical protein